MSKPPRPRAAQAAAALVSAVLPLAAVAHPGHADAGASALMAGFWHPLTGADHLIALLAIGVWTALAARRGHGDLWTLPVSLMAALLTGALLAHAGLALPAVEPMIALSLLVLGLALARPAPGGGSTTPMTLAVVAGFAFFHGAAHGTELPSLAGLAGMAAASAMLCAVGVVGGLAARHRSRWLPRLAGAGVGLMGLGMLAGLLP